MQVQTWALFVFTLHKSTPSITVMESNHLRLFFLEHLRITMRINLEMSHIQTSGLCRDENNKEICFLWNVREFHWRLIILNLLKDYSKNSTTFKFIQTTIVQWHPSWHENLNLNWFKIYIKPVLRLCIYVCQNKVKYLPHHRLKY